jgi:Flp pilus assembly protein TadG
MVEAALTLTIALMFLFGTMQFAQAVWAYNLLAHASRTAARYAIAHGTKSMSTADTAKISSIVSNQVIGLSGVTTTTTWTPDKSPGSSVKVKVSYTYNFIGPYMPAASVTMASTSQMTIIQ